MERHLAHEVQAHHHHPGDPEEDDVEAGDQRAGSGRSASAPASCPASPGSRTATARRRTRCRARPRRCRERLVAAVVLRWRRLAASASVSLDEDLAVRPVPGRDLVAPPELARDAPGLDVAHPLEVGLLPVLRARSRCSPSSTALIAGLASALGVHVPLVGQIRARRTTPERSPCGTAWRVVSILSQQAQRLEIGDHLLARLEAVEAAIGLPARSSFSCAVGVEDVDQRQVVALADLEVVEVVRRRDLHRAGALLRIGIFVGDDRDRAVRRAAGAPACRSGAL